MTITILSSNQAALLAIGHPDNSNQGKGASNRSILEKVRALRVRANTVRGQWVPSLRTVEVSGRAKRAAKQSTEQGKTPEGESKAGQGDHFNRDETSGSRPKWHYLRMSVSILRR